MLWNGARFAELSGLLCLRSVAVTKEPRVPHSTSPPCAVAGTNDIFAKVFEANGLVGVPLLRYNRCSVGGHGSTLFFPPDRVQAVARCLPRRADPARAVCGAERLLCTDQRALTASASSTSALLVEG
jgi:hypothetical protein